MTKAQEFSAWLGRKKITPAETATHRLVASFDAVFGSLAARSGEISPGIHWCMFCSYDQERELGLDGHPKKGGFLPPIRLPRRMWAGGEVEFIQPIQKDAVLEKMSKITDVTQKSGKSGELCFVTVEHLYCHGDLTLIQEKQHIVFRAAANVTAQPQSNEMSSDQFESSTQFLITPITLFRYSALTFNSHRIHYDREYARDQEYYSDLVIHGPLQATALLNFATTVREQVPRKFDYRGVEPAQGSQVLTLGSNQVGPNENELYMLTESGVVTMKATAEW